MSGIGEGTIGGELGDEIKPTVKEVAILIRSRTRTNGDKLIGTFTDDGETEPTATEVQEIIDSQAAWLEGQAYPCEGKDKLRAQFKSLVALGAAMEIESSYWPDQVGTERSNYDQLKDRYDPRLKSYIEGVEEQCPEGNPPEGGTGQGTMALGDFPDAAGFGCMKF